MVSVLDLYLIECLLTFPFSLYIIVSRIDEIHQQLEEQLSVLANFIDGVANLRPKGLF